LYSDELFLAHTDPSDCNSICLLLAALSVRINSETLFQFSRTEETMVERKMIVAIDITDATRAAMAMGYTPYSEFRVGAAVRDEQERIHSGCNVENAAYPEGICAEACALAAMMPAGARRRVEVAIVACGDALATPCGGCRQKLREFSSDDAQVFVFNKTGKKLRSFLLGDPLPHSLGSANMRGNNIA
jgi:cytidine deaminase